MVIVDLLTATICFLGSCHNVLVGPDTPSGQFKLAQRLTKDPGYGGDVLQFKETEKDVYAIHRVWLLKPAQRRAERIKSHNITERTSITNGCINVEPEVYQELVDCCSNDTLIVK
jgi:hypothetical protein